MLSAAVVIGALRANRSQHIHIFKKEKNSWTYVLIFILYSR